MRNANRIGEEEVYIMLEEEKEAKRQAAFAMMGAGEPSGSEKSWT